MEVGEQRNQEKPSRLIPRIRAGKQVASTPREKATSVWTKT